MCLATFKVPFLRREEELEYEHSNSPSRRKKGTLKVAKHVRKSTKIVPPWIKKIYFADPFYQQRADEHSLKLRIERRLDSVVAENGHMGGSDGRARASI